MLTTALPVAVLLVGGTSLAPDSSRLIVKGAMFDAGGVAPVAVDAGAAGVAEGVVVAAGVVSAGAGSLSPPQAASEANTPADTTRMNDKRESVDPISAPLLCAIT